MNRRSVMGGLSVVAFLTASCSPVAYRPAVFDDHPVVVAVYDRVPTGLPVVTLPNKVQHRIESYSHWALVSKLAPSVSALAGDVNRYDEVVTSSWFAGSAPAAMPPRKTAAPVKPSEQESRYEKPSFTAITATGRPVEIIVDDPRFPMVRTSGAWFTAAVTRELGYHAPTVSFVTEDGARFAVVDYPGDESLGPHSSFLTRGDDPNDRIQPERRRSLRATKIIAAWLDATRFPEHSIIDRFVKTDDKLGYVIHVVDLLDGALGISRHRRRLTPTDYRGAGSGWLLLTLGLAPNRPELPLVAGPPGLVLGADVLADGWPKKRVGPPYAPHAMLNPGDAYWMIKRINAISRTRLAELARKSELPEATARALVDRLVKRRNALTQALFLAVTPCEPKHTEHSAAELIFRCDGIDAATVWFYTQGGVAIDDVAASVVAGRMAVVPPSELPSRYVVSIIAGPGRTARRPADFHYRDDGAGRRLVGIVH